MLIKFPIKYIFSYYFNLLDGDYMHGFNNENQLKIDFERYIQDCEDDEEIPEYNNYIEYTLAMGKPDSWLHPSYHGEFNGLISNEMHPESICTYSRKEQLPTFSDYGYWREIEYSTEIVEDMIWGQSLCWHKITKEDLWKSAIFLIDWHHRTFSAIRTMDKYPKLDFIYLDTQESWIIKLYGNK